MKLNNEELKTIKNALEGIEFFDEWRSLAVPLLLKVNKELTRHDWKLLGKPGLYDDDYKCSKCGEVCSSSADGDDGRTEFGCPGET